MSDLLEGDVVPDPVFFDHSARAEIVRKLRRELGSAEAGQFQASFERSFPSRPELTPTELPSNRVRALYNYLVSDLDPVTLQYPYEIDIVVSALEQVEATNFLARLDEGIAESVKREKRSLMQSLEERRSELS